MRSRSEGRETTRRFGVGCAAIFAVALVLRVAHVVALRGAPFFDLEMGDARSYSNWARSLAEGDWLGSAIFYQAPLYPYFLGVLYSLAGDDLLVVRLVQALLGALTCVLLADAGRRFFDPVAGLLAGLLLAVYAPALFFDGLIQKTSLGSFLLCLSLWFASRIASDSRPREWFAFAFVLGLLVLTRENALVFVAVAILWLAVAFRSDARGPLCAIALAGGLLLPLGTVGVRNYVVGGEFHITTSQLGPNFYIGNNAGATGAYMPLLRGQGDPKAEQHDARRIAQADVGRELSPSEVSRYWVGRAWGDIRDDPTGWLGLSLRKFGLAANATEIGDTEFLDQHAAWSPVLRATSFLHFGWIAPLAVVGLLTTWRDRRRLWPLYALIASYGASLVAFYVMARYRFPLVPLLLPFAGAAFTTIGPFLRNASPAARATLAAAAIAAVVVCNLPIDPRLTPRWVADYNVGGALLEVGRTDEAVAAFERALGLGGDEALIRTQLGVALHRQGRLDASLAQFERVIADDPEFLDARLGASRVLIALGREPQALAQLRKAGRIAPGSPRPLNNAAWLLATSQQIDERTAKRALKMARRANELTGESDLSVLDTLAAAYAANGRFDEAVSIANRVEELARDQGQQELAERAAERLALYRTGQRFIAKQDRDRESP